MVRLGCYGLLWPVMVRLGCYGLLWSVMTLRIIEVNFVHCKLLWMVLHVASCLLHINIQAYGGASSGTLSRISCVLDHIIAL